MFNGIDCVSRYIGKKGIWAIDRQGDIRTILRKFIQEQKQFVVRLKNNRNVIYKEKNFNVAKLANQTQTPYEAKVISYQDGKGKHLDI